MAENCLLRMISLGNELCCPRSTADFGMDKLDSESPSQGDVHGHGVFSGKLELARVPLMSMG